MDSPRCAWHSSGNGMRDTATIVNSGADTSMASRRRIGVEGSETWALLLDTAELIMREEGYPAVTTRRLAGRMGVSSQLVHYYFRSMDDLFLALMRRGQ